MKLMGFTEWLNKSKRRIPRKKGEEIMGCEWGMSLSISHPRPLDAEGKVVPAAGDGAVRMGARSPAMGASPGVAALPRFLPGSQALSSQSKV